MKRIIISVLILLVGVSLFANDLTGYGIGETREEAKLNARKDLLASIRLNVSVETTISLYDDGEDVEGTFFENVKSSSSGILKGVEEKTEKKAADSWEATCSISESKAYLYENEIKSLIESINNCQKEIDKGLEPKEEIAYLETQLKKYELFDFYNDVLLLLGHFNNEKPAVGKEIAQSRFSIIIDQLDKPSNTVVDSGKSANEYKKLIEEYEERQKLKEQIEKQNKEELEQYQKKLSDAQKELLASYEDKAKKAYDKIKTNKTSTAFVDLVDSYVDARAGFVSLFEDNRNTISQLNTSNINLITSARKEIFNQPYDSLVEMKNGKPTQKALAVRTEKADAGTLQLIETQNELYLENYDKFISSMGEFCTVYNPIKEKINNKSFTVSSQEEGSSFVVGRYDATTYSWPFAFSFSILGHTFTVNGNISDKKVQQLAKKAENDWKEVTEYHSLVELYDALYHSDWSLLVECSYTSTIDVDSGTVIVRIVSCKVTRLDDNSEIGTVKLDESFEYTFSGSSPVSLVFNCLGMNQDATREYAVSMFLGDELASSNLYAYSYEEKDGFGLGRINISENNLSEILNLADSLNNECRKKRAEIKTTGKGYGELVNIVDRVGCLQKILQCFGEDLPTDLLNEIKNKNDLEIEALNEKYSDMLDSNVPDDMLTPGVKDIISHAESMWNGDVSEGYYKEVFSDCDVMISKLDKIYNNLRFAYRITYKNEEEIVNAYRDLQQFEAEVTSKIYKSSLPQSAFTHNIKFLYGQDIEDLVITYNVKDEYKEEIGEISFEISLESIVGKRPSNIDKMEAYFDKVVAAFLLLTGDYDIFVVDVNSYIETDSENLNDSVRKYDPFERVYINAEVVLRSSYGDRVIYNEMPIMAFSTWTYLQSIDSPSGQAKKYLDNFDELVKKEKKDTIKDALAENMSMGIFGSITNKDNWFTSLTEQTFYCSRFWFFDLGLLGFPLFKTSASASEGLGLAGAIGAVGVKTPTLTLGRDSDSTLESYLRAGVRCYMGERLFMGSFCLYFDATVFAGGNISFDVDVEGKRKVGISVDYSYGLKTFFSSTLYFGAVNANVYLVMSL